MKKTAKYNPEKIEDLKHYIHGFQQQKLIDLQLSNDDALLLRVLVDLYSMASAEFLIKNDNRYLWVSYNKVSRTIPILGSKSNIMGKVKYFEDLKLVDRITKFERKGVKGTFAYIRPLERLDWLTEYQNDKEDPIQNLDRGYPNFRQGVSKKKIGGIQNLDNKDSSLKDSSLKDSSLNNIYLLDEKNLNNINTTSELKNDVGFENPTEQESKINKSSKKKAKIFDPDSQEIKASRYLFNKMIENNPNSKNPDFQKWAKHIDLMLRGDKRKLQDIKAVIDFSQNDNFWKCNILSTSKLREKFDSLFLKMNSCKPQNNKKSQLDILDDILAEVEGN